MALDISELVVHIQVNREHVTPEDEDNARRFNEAMRAIYETLHDVTAAAERSVAQFVAELEHGIDGDETHGMTLEELIPETIAEWKRIRDEEEQP